MDFKMHPYVCMIEYVINHNNRLTDLIKNNQEAFKKTGIDKIISQTDSFKQMISM